MEQQNRRFVGLDFGVRTYEMCMYDENGKIVRSNGLTTPEGRQKLYSKLKPTDRVGIEMCSLTMKVAREMKSAVGCDVLLLHAGKLAVIYKSLKKTDKEDALKLARLVKTHEDEELPIVPLPSEVDLKKAKDDSGGKTASFGQNEGSEQTTCTFCGMRYNRYKEEKSCNKDFTRKKSSVA